MFISHLGTGMMVGAAAAGLWIAKGGSVLMGFALYSLVSTTFVLGMVALLHVMSEWRLTDEDGGAADSGEGAAGSRSPRGARA